MNRILAVILVIISIPANVLISLLLLVTQGAPLFFIQKRIGKDGLPFDLIKYRTIVEVNGQMTITPVGAFFRKLGIDEIPQLLNIAKGEMNFIGPRPLPVSYLVLLSPDENVRHMVRPGITGLAQVNGRNTLSWEEKFTLDMQYVNNYSMYLDFLIFLRTFSVLGTEGGKMTPLDQVR